mmetsp:Transcript_21535/g.66775  ORF Transcript_21535/g.66775 Transcript_21535/m.66775 type:complete len:250 (-) Transcript_21535:340-1089(-)
MRYVVAIPRSCLSASAQRATTSATAASTRPSICASRASAPSRTAAATPTTTSSGACDSRARTTAASSRRAREASVVASWCTCIKASAVVSASAHSPPEVSASTAASSPTASPSASAAMLRLARTPARNHVAYRASSCRLSLRKRSASAGTKQSSAQQRCMAAQHAAVGRSAKPCPAAPAGAGSLPALAGATAVSSDSASSLKHSVKYTLKFQRDANCTTAACARNACAAGEPGRPASASRPSRKARPAL